MITALKNPEKASFVFEGWEDTMITSCLQGVMGTVYVTDPDDPKSACARLGCFVFYAGMPDEELALYPQEKEYTILVPQNEDWTGLLTRCRPDAVRSKRFAIRKDTVFDREKLKRIADSLPESVEIKQIDDGLYDRCLLSPVAADFVSVFESKERFLRDGIGFVALKDGRIVSGASSYSRYRDGIEIEVDTVPEERRKGLAAACCATLILECLRQGLTPSWDAHTKISVRLAESLGYQFSHEYTIFELGRDGT